MASRSARRQSHKLSLNDLKIGNRADPFTLASPDSGKVGPTDLHTRHRREGRGGRVQTGPSGSRSAARHWSGRSAANPTRPRHPSRTASEASSMSHRGPGLGPQAACSEPLDRWTSRTFGSVSDLQGKERSTPEPHGCGLPDILPHRAVAETAPCSCRGRVLRTDTVVRPVHPTDADPFGVTFDGMSLSNCSSGLDNIRLIPKGHPFPLYQSASMDIGMTWITTSVPQELFRQV